MFSNYNQLKFLFISMPGNVEDKSMIYINIISLYSFYCDSVRFDGIHTPLCDRFISCQKFVQLRCKKNVAAIVNKNKYVAPHTYYIPH